ncbi:MAG: hypothetical protein ACN6O3_06355 [Comamonas sp.]
MDALSIELAKRVGQVLTLDDAKAVARAVYSGKALDFDSIAPGWHAGDYTLKPIWLDSAFDELESQRLRGLAEIYPGEPVDVRWDRIRDLERQGLHVIFAAVAPDGRIAASLWLFFTPSLNNGLPCVTDDFLYVEPDARDGMLAPGLCHYAEAVMFGLGARSCTLRTHDVNQVGRLAKFMGYRKVADLYRKTNFTDDASINPTRHQGAKRGECTR